MKTVFYLERLIRAMAIFATIIAGLWFGSAHSQPIAARDVSDVAISCDEDITLGSSWRDAIYESAVDTIICYRLNSLAVSQIRRESLRRQQPLSINLIAQSGQYDLYLLRASGVAPVARTANKLNTTLILPGNTQTYSAGTLQSGSYLVMVVPRVAGNYWLTLGIGASPAPVLAPPLAQANQCSPSWGALSNFCIEAPGLVTQNGAINVLWRIANFRYGEFDSGDGRGFVGPIAAEQRVIVNSVAANRTIKLRWWDLNNTERIDTLQVTLGTVVAAPTQVPQIAVNPNYFPCSRSGIGSSNLCIEQPYPIRRGTSAVAVWRISSFRSGSFDSGDGRGLVGPINAEQRIVIPNVTANRTISLRWIDGNGVEHNDSFLIQVVD